ncbi:MAG: hypothetical protein DRI95_11725 [Bacteroidetes bacterium]|nr:MAG: hypothetical protein DRI95_11725 [Bacteroidota bacterium]
MELKKKNIIDTWLDKYGDSEIEKFVEKNIAITEKVNNILHERGISKAQFANMLGKKPSEVSKWLSGSHNLTLKSIIKMENALDVDLINIDPEIEIKYVYLGSVQGKNIQTAISEYEESNYDNNYSHAI